MFRAYKHIVGSEGAGSKQECLAGVGAAVYNCFHLCVEADAPCTARHHHLTTPYSAQGHIHNTTARLLPAKEVKYRVTRREANVLIWFGKGSTTLYKSPDIPNVFRLTRGMFATFVTLVDTGLAP